MIFQWVCSRACRPGLAACLWCLTEMLMQGIFDCSSSRMFQEHRMALSFFHVLSQLLCLKSHTNHPFLLLFSQPQKGCRVRGGYLLLPDCTQRAPKQTTKLHSSSCLAPAFSSHPTRATASLGQPSWLRWCRCLGVFGWAQPTTDQLSLRVYRSLTTAKMKHTHLWWGLIGFLCL